jgi:hypothetical protein
MLLTSGKTGFDVSWIKQLGTTGWIFSKWWFWYFSTIICL